jgi:hypothetical protein
MCISSLSEKNCNIAVDTFTKIFWAIEVISHMDLGKNLDTSSKINLSMHIINPLEIF